MVGPEALDLEMLYDRITDAVADASDPDPPLTVADVFLFGSTARGDADPPESDVDLLIVVDRENGPALSPEVDRQLRRIADDIEFRAPLLLSGTPFDEIDPVLTIPQNASQRLNAKTTDRGGGNTSPVIRLPGGERV
jgi:hypothetical protein